MAARALLTLTYIEQYFKIFEFRHEHKGLQVWFTASYNQTQNFRNKVSNHITSGIQLTSCSVNVLLAYAVPVLKFALYTGWGGGWDITKEK